MRVRQTAAAIAVMSLVASANVEAQVAGPQESDRRPSAPTVLGDTGLWFVPTAEVLPSGQWSISTFRVNADRQQGLTDVSHFTAGGAIGIRDRLEVFGSLNADTRIDRDLRPLNNADAPIIGGVDTEYPFVANGFARGRGDLSLGAKFNVLSESRGQPVAFAVRSLVKLPTGDQAKGVTTGEADVIVDAIASRHVGSVEVAGFGGTILRGDPSNVDLPNGVRWGVGAGFPAPARLRLVTELHGEIALDDNVVVQQPLVANDGSASPLRSFVRNPVDALFGMTWQAPNGIAVGAGVSWAARMRSNDVGVSVSPDHGDRFGFQMGMSFRPGRRRVVPQVADAAPSRSAAASPAVAPRPAPAAPAADPAPMTFVFEDVHFDFDRHTLRPEAIRVLDEAVRALTASPSARVTIDGHTCNIGTAEYNLALADRRASAVRDYLVSRGVSAGRLTTVAYGEERPGYDNTREETRRLNRRAALVVELDAAADAQ